MTKYISSIALFALLISCGNKVEEVKYPENGQLKLKYEYYEDESGQKVKDGAYTEWNFDGSKKIEFTYEKGKLNGPYKKYLGPDSLFAGNLKNGKEDGITKLIGHDITYAEISCVKGLRVGKQIYYFEDGKINIMAHRNSKGKLTKWTCFNNKGKINAEFTFNKSGAAKELSGNWVADSKMMNKEDNYRISFDNDRNARFYAPTSLFAVTYSGKYDLFDELFIKSDKDFYFSILEASKDKLVFMARSGELLFFVRR